MKTMAVPLLVLLLGAAACDYGPATAPTGFTSSGSTPVLGVYLATLTASASCEALPAVARERTYTATLLADGRIAWTGPTLRPPPGHSPVSKGSLSEDTFSFSIDIERSPRDQSDNFHGLTDALGGGTSLTIAGKGRGVVRGGDITGAFEGLFSFYEPVADPNVLWTARYCKASDHQFRFLKQ